MNSSKRFSLSMTWKELLRKQKNYLSHIKFCKRENMNMSAHKLTKPSNQTSGQPNQLKIRKFCVSWPNFRLRWKNKKCALMTRFQIQKIILLWPEKPIIHHFYNKLKIMSSYRPEKAQVHLIKIESNSAPHQINKNIIFYIWKLRFIEKSSIFFLIWCFYIYMIQIFE